MAESERLRETAQVAVVRNRGDEQRPLAADASGCIVSLIRRDRWTGVSFHNFQKKQKHPVIRAAPKNHRIASKRIGSFPWPSPGDFLGNYDFSNVTTERLPIQPSRNGTSKCSKNIASLPLLAIGININPKDFSSSHVEPKRPDVSPKRGRPLALPSANVSHDITSEYHDSEREGEANARQLPLNFVKSKKPEANQNQVLLNEETVDEGLGSSQVVDGLCLDICPVLEIVRVERKRKKELAQHECSDGKINLKKKHKKMRTQTDVPLENGITKLDKDLISSYAKPQRHDAFSKKGMSSCLPSAHDSWGTCSVHHVSEREMEVQAKRLARFSEELINPEANHNHASLDKKIKDCADQCLESSQLMVGLCPDMCPESERREREWKGDLDMYECLNDKRNQTSKFIAIKKYTRTAEQDAGLIRPMPVLQMTVDYLLDLLERPYDDKFLGIYNFMWDRMRAIRMDLRMQHIFDPEASAMLEKMIRLHVIAMHELCEQKNEEGFSKGFDAYLNIEQMNKTSIELFQMYDANRKKGITSETEKEFRGYYALLKLDKHPSYKVEPADFSRDLSRMTSEIRSTSEILFAREVSRACRIGNYVSFFRLAKKATYLQACLMHAHFGKVRRLALASLHKGLRCNHGIPISDIAKWLAVEDEDVHTLLEYHGFVLKSFGEMHMVKEGPFLNIDSDFTIKCSQLVHSKKSKSIVDDVCSSPTISEDTERKLSEEDSTLDSEVERLIFTQHFPACGEGVPVWIAKETSHFSEIVQKEVELDVASKRTDPPNVEADINLNDKEILHCKNETLLEVGTATEKLVEGQLAANLNRESVDDSEGSTIESHSLFLDTSTRTYAPQVVGDPVFTDQTLPESKESKISLGVPESSYPSHIIPNSCLDEAVDRTNEELLVSELNRFEVIDEILMSIWKQRSSTHREIRKQREMGNQKRDPSKRAFEELNIDNVVNERRVKQKKSWSPLNVSKLIAPILSSQNSDASCICWKMAVFVQASGLWDPKYQCASQWLLTKLRGQPNDDGLALSRPQLSIWKSWSGICISNRRTCILSIIREAMIEDNQSSFDDDVFTGTSCIVFIVSEIISWEIQQFRLHSLLMAVPPGSCLPLSVVSTLTHNSDFTEMIITKLGLDDTEGMRIGTFSILFLARDLVDGQPSGLFSGDQLREPLEWLAYQSPKQPSVRKVQIKEQMFSYLNHATSVLSSMDALKVGPDQCISVFNEALAHLANEIIATASENLNNWPCPSISQLRELSPEQKSAKMFLPSIGWSSTARVESLASAINACKLAPFPSSMPWLQEGCRVSSELHNQKGALEECLAKYLTELSCSMHNRQALSEAVLMIQSCASLELRGSFYYIVPRWIEIFQRIFNWQLMRLPIRGFFEAYVKLLDGPEAMDVHQPVYSVRTTLTLNEMIQGCCSVPVAPHHLPSVGCSLDNEITNEASSCSLDIEITNKASSSHHASQLVEEKEERVIEPLEQAQGRLEMLLNQCKLVQDRISKTLAVYF